MASDARRCEGRCDPAGTAATFTFHCGWRAVAVIESKQEKDS